MSKKPGADEFNIDINALYKDDEASQATEGIDWRNVFSKIGDFLDLLFSGVAEQITGKDYAFKLKYYKLTKEEWDQEETPQDPKQKEEPGALYTRIDFGADKGKYRNNKTGEVVSLSEGEKEGAKAQAELEAAESASARVETGETVALADTSSPAGKAGMDKLNGVLGRTFEKAHNGPVESEDADEYRLVLAEEPNSNPLKLG